MVEQDPLSKQLSMVNGATLTISLRRVSRSIIMKLSVTDANGGIERAKLFESPTKFEDWVKKTGLKFIEYVYEDMDLRGNPLEEYNFLKSAVKEFLV